MSRHMTYLADYEGSLAQARYRAYRQAWWDDTPATAAYFMRLEVEHALGEPITQAQAKRWAKIEDRILNEARP